MTYPLFAIIYMQLHAKAVERGDTDTASALLHSAQVWAQPARDTVGSCSA